MLDLVERQIEDINTELNVQMKRMAQLQAQVDELLVTVRRLTSSPPSS